MIHLLLVLQLGALQGGSANSLADWKAPAWKNTKTADILSDVTLGVSLGVDTWDSFHCVDKKHCFVKQAERTAVNIGAAELVKRIIHRDRPDMSDNMSFYSEHTALTAMGPRLVFTLPLTFGTGYLRMAANKHYFTDVVVGAGVGLLTGHFIK